MKILKLFLMSFMFIFLAYFTANSSYAVCGGDYPITCDKGGGLILCGKYDCNSFLVTQEGGPNCITQGRSYFGYNNPPSDQEVCQLYCAELTPQKCPAGHTGYVTHDPKINICRTICYPATCSPGGSNCTTGWVLTCKNGYYPKQINNTCSGFGALIDCTNNSVCGKPTPFTCSLSVSVSGSNATLTVPKTSGSSTGYNRIQWRVVNNATGVDFYKDSTIANPNTSNSKTVSNISPSGSYAFIAEYWKDPGSGSTLCGNTSKTVGSGGGGGTAPTATFTPSPTTKPGGGGGTAPTATRTPTNTPIPDGGGGGGGDDTYPPILYLDIRLFNDANNNGSKDIGEKNNTGAGTITTSTSMSPNCSGSGTRTYSFNKGGVSLGPGDSLTNDPMCVYVQSFDGPVIHDNPRMVTPSASASDYWFGVYISEVPTSTPTPVGTTYNITGTVYVDNDPEGPGLCTTSAPVGDLSVTLSGSTGSIKVASVGSTGTYALNGSTGITAPYALTVSKTGYSLRAVKTGSGPFVSAGPGNDYPITNLSTTYTFCLKDNTETVVPWFMTQIGSVRQQHITNTVPAGQLPTTTDNTASVFYSTQGITNLGSALGTKWTVNQEYDRVKGLNRPGNASFSFYKNRAQTVGIELMQLCPGNTGECHISGTTVNAGLANGVYYHPGNVVLDTDVTITNTPKRFVILSEGSITLKGQVRLVNTPNSLIIFAAKQNIIVDPTVGTTPSNTAFNIQAILSAENNIQLPSSASCPTPDKRLNIEGTLIANADNPFGQEIAGGKLLNNRTLCTDNASYPSLFVRSRLSFITQLSDFYKLTSKFWNEVAP